VSRRNNNNNNIKCAVLTMRVYVCECVECVRELTNVNRQLFWPTLLAIAKKEQQPAPMEQLAKRPDNNNKCDSNNIKNVAITIVSTGH